MNEHPLITYVHYHPSLMTTWSVQQIRANRKTMTRRVIKKARNEVGEWAGAVLPAREDGWIAWWPGTGPGLAEFTKKAYSHGFPCPYGVPGDVLWVKETFGYVWPELCDNGMVYGESGPTFDCGRPIRRDECKVIYRADEPDFAWADEGGDPRTMWKASLFMPWRLARVFLRVLEVRPERVQEINDADVFAEGCESRAEFIEVWDGLYRAKEPWKRWAANPWVWAIRFERKEQ